MKQSKIQVKQRQKAKGQQAKKLFLGSLRASRAIKKQVFIPSQFLLKILQFMTLCPKFLISSEPLLTSLDFNEPSKIQDTFDVVGDSLVWPFDFYLNLARNHTVLESREKKSVTSKKIRGSSHHFSQCHHHLYDMDDFAKRYLWTLRFDGKKLLRPGP